MGSEGTSRLFSFHSLTWFFAVYKQESSHGLEMTAGTIQAADIRRGSVVQRKENSWVKCLAALSLSSPISEMGIIASTLSFVKKNSLVSCAEG